MKKHLSLLLCLLLIAALLPMHLETASADDRGLEINETNFPDENFRQWIIENLQVSGDADTGYYMTEEQVGEVKEIWCFEPVCSLKGIELFQSLTYFLVTSEQLSDLDLSRNTALASLGCYNSQIEELDLSNNLALCDLTCQNNNSLTKLDMSNHPALEQVNCTFNEQLTELDVSNCPALQTLYCQYNELTELDVSSNPELRELACTDNQLTELTVGNNPELQTLNCGYNELTELDVSNNPALQTLNCGYNQLTELDVSSNPELRELACTDNQLTILDLSGNSALKRLDCYNNQLTELDISNCPALEALFCHNNELTELDVRNCQALEHFECDHNQLTELDVSNCPALQILYCYDNELTDLDVSNCPAIRALNCSNNELTELDVSRNTELERLDCYFNQLTELDVRNCQALKYFACYYNQLTELDVSNNTELEELVCESNQLTELDVSNNSALTNLWCGCNRMTELDLSSVPALSVLYCYNNQLPMLDLSKNTALETVSIYGQTVENQKLQKINGVYTFDLTKLMPIECVANVTMEDDDHLLDTETGIVTFPSKISFWFKYQYATGRGSMEVCVNLADSDDRYLEIDETNFPDETFRQWIIENLSVSGDADTGYYMTEDQVDAVTVICCSGQEIASLAGISNFPELARLEARACGLETIDLTQNEKLTYLVLGNNQLTALDVSNNTELGHLYCYGNQLTELDLSNNTELVHLYCYGNQLTALDVSHNTALEYLSCANNQLAALDVSSNTELRDLICYGNQLAALDVSHNTALEYLSCGYNRLAALDVSNNTELWELNCYGNQLTALDISGSTALEYLDCENNQLTSLDVSHNTALEYLSCSDNRLAALDVSSNTELRELYCYDNQLTALDVSSNTELRDLYCYGNQLTALDLSHNTALEYLSCENNQLTALDVSSNTELRDLYCYNNQLTALDISGSTALEYLDCGNNQLTALDVSHNTALEYLVCENNHLTVLNLLNNPQTEEFWANGQTVAGQKLERVNSVYTYDLTKLMPIECIANVTPEDDTNLLNTDNGLVSFPSEVDSFVYLYATGRGSMEVTVCFQNSIAVEGTVEWNPEDVEFKGTTPYVIANGSAQTPRFVVKNKADGSVIDPAFYDFEYRENTNAGTGYVFVTFKDGYEGTCRGSFKIYLPATTATTVENVQNGIKLTWEAVPGAAGYVIYRRAWSSTTDGWTDFVRWNNTTALEWVDTAVYAGTRYQYGIKAYFAKRTDPVTGAQIGGNVGDNFNLGEVGPLKTTVRITTRTLNSVTPGDKQMTVKWGASSNFTGYQIKYATNAAFTKNVKAIKINNPKTASQVITGLLANTTYYVTVRSYHEFNGVTYYGEWSNVLSAKVGSAPTITGQPAAKTVALGKTATFKVTASGTGLTYQWQYSKNNGKTWTNWSGKTSASVTVTGSATNNGCLYRCVVKNTYGNVTSNSAKLTVTGVK